MTALAYTLVALATYRVATDVAWEDGPFDVYAHLRGWAVSRLGAGHWAAEGLACPICVSFWAAPALLALWWYAPFVVAWLAVAGAAALFVRLK